MFHHRTDRQTSRKQPEQSLPPWPRGGFGSICLSQQGPLYGVADQDGAARPGERNRVWAVAVMTVSAEVSIPVMSVFEWWLVLFVTSWTSSFLSDPFFPTILLLFVFFPSPGTLLSHKRKVISGLPIPHHGTFTIDLSPEKIQEVIENLNCHLRTVGRVSSFVVHYALDTLYWDTQSSCPSLEFSVFNSMTYCFNFTSVVIKLEKAFKGSLYFRLVYKGWRCLCYSLVPHHYSTVSVWP